MQQAEDHLGEVGKRPLDALVRHANGSLAGQSNGSVVGAASARALDAATDKFACVLRGPAEED